MYNLSIEEQKENLENLSINELIEECKIYEINTSKKSKSDLIELILIESQIMGL